MYAVLLLVPVALASLKLDTAAASPPSTDAEEAAAAAVAPSASLLETGEGKAQLTAEEQAALQIVAAHLVYLDKTEEMVKRTQSMMDEVLQDKRMSITDKIEALHMLAGHLAVLQESAQKTLAGMGLDSDDLLDEAKRMREEEALEHKMHDAAASHAAPSSFLELRSSIEEIAEDEDDEADDKADPPAGFACGDLLVISRELDGLGSVISFCDGVVVDPSIEERADN